MEISRHSQRSRYRRMQKMCKWKEQLWRTLSWKMIILRTYLHLQICRNRGPKSNSNCGLEPKLCLLKLNTNCSPLLTRPTQPYILEIKALLRHCQRMLQDGSDDHLESCRKSRCPARKPCCRIGKAGRASRSRDSLARERASYNHPQLARVCST